MVILCAFLSLLLSSCTDRDPTGPTPDMELDEKFWIRVLLQENVDACVISVVCPTDVFDGNDVLRAQFDDETEVQISIDGGGLVVNGTSLDAEQLSFEPNEPFIFAYNGDQYRGKLQIIADLNSSTFKAINIVPVEPYLAGVVAAEMPPHWEPSALEAQCIAARTYCLFIKERFGKNRDYDVKRTEANQAYHGVKVESAAIWDIVNRTRGIVLCHLTESGDTEIFPTYYSSICGGHTENSQNVFGGQYYEQLSGVDCPWCEKMAKESFFFWETVKLEKKLVHERLKRRYSSINELGTIEDISVIGISQYDGFSRTNRVEISGPDGKSDWIRGEDLRLSIDSSGRVLRSTVFDLGEDEGHLYFKNGRGFGHGVGMCQYGALGMARNGSTSKEILSYYYPEAIFKTIY